MAGVPVPGAPGGFHAGLAGLVCHSQARNWRRRRPGCALKTGHSGLAADASPASEPEAPALDRPAAERARLPGLDWQRFGGVGLLGLPLFLFFVIPIVALLLPTPGVNVLGTLGHPAAWQAIGR